MDDLIGSLLDCFPDPTILLDEQRIVMTANSTARDLLDITALGKDLSMSMRHPRVLGAVDAVIGRDASQTVEIVLPGLATRHYEMHVAGVPLVKGDPEGDEALRPTRGNAIRAVLILRDQTRARRAEQMRADFVANASHELRSPLAALLGFIETLDGPAGNEPETRERFLGIMMREAQRMAGLIDDLLMLSKVEINENVRPTGPVDVKAILGDVMESLSAQAEGRNITIQAEYDKDLPVIYGEADQLFQVFRNLVENAIRYGTDEDSIEIYVQAEINRSDRRQPALVVKVTDHGEGIPAEAIPRLTERFYRVDKARSNSLGGTGLGLAIVKHILNRHRGHLTVESELGQGSTFSVHLPSDPIRPGVIAELRNWQAGA